MGGWSWFCIGSAPVFCSPSTMNTGDRRLRRVERRVPQSRGLLGFRLAALSVVVVWAFFFRGVAGADQSQESSDSSGKETQPEQPEDSEKGEPPQPPLVALDIPVVTAEESMRHRHAVVVEHLSVDIQDAFGEVEAALSLCASLPEADCQAALSRFGGTFEYGQLVRVYDVSDAPVESAQTPAGEAADDLATSLEQLKKLLRHELLKITEDGRDEREESNAGLALIAEGFSRVTTALSRALQEVVEKTPGHPERLRMLTDQSLPGAMENMMLCVMVLRKRFSVLTVTLRLRLQRLVRLLKDFGSALTSTVKGQQSKISATPSRRPGTSLQKRGKILDKKTVLSFVIGFVVALIPALSAVGPIVI